MPSITVIRPPTTTRPAPTTTRAPTTTVSPTPTPAPTTVRPPPVNTEAAVRLSWGTPIAGETDEFNYTGRPDTARWTLPSAGCWPGHAGNGRRCPDRATVNGTALVLTGLANGDTAWIAGNTDRQYGRWEARIRSSETGPGNHSYHVLALIWPSSERWPHDGEYDWFEIDRPGQACAVAFLHYPHPPGPVQQEQARETNCGAPLSEWTNVAFEWAPAGVAGYLDGVQWFRYSGGAGPGGRGAIQSMPSGHLNFQVDNFHGSGMRPAQLEVDWLRSYRP
jgi:hypothetical protein